MEYVREVMVTILIKSKLNTMETTIEFTPYLASAYAEGFCEGEDATFEEQISAWSYLIKTGMVWQLQGWYGRTAHSLINSGLLHHDGNINWDNVNEYIDNNLN